MIARLYYNKSDKRNLNKDIELINDINIELKQDTSIIHPTLILSNGSGVMGANYIHIPDLHRYYYIDNITASQQRLIIECSVDVLMSNKNEILNCEVVLDRSENNYNLYLPDDNLKLYGYQYYQIKKLNPITSLHFNMNTEQFVLNCAGGV